MSDERRTLAELSRIASSMQQPGILRRRPRVSRARTSSSSTVRPRSVQSYVRSEIVYDEEKHLLMKRWLTTLLKNDICYNQNFNDEGIVLLLEASLSCALRIISDYIHTNNIPYQKWELVGIATLRLTMAIFGLDEECEEGFIPVSALLRLTSRRYTVREFNDIQMNIYGQYVNNFCTPEVLAVRRLGTQLNLV